MSKNVPNMDGIAFVEIKRIQKFVCKWMLPVAVSTQDEYDRALVRLAGAHWRDYASAHNLGKRAASVLRAAWRRDTAIRIDEWLSKRTHLTDPDDQRRLQHQIQILYGELIKDKRSPAYQPEIGVQSAGKKSKRKSLKGLPHDWRDQMIEHARLEDQMPLLVMTLCGCRPAELKKGIRVNSDSSLLIFHIQGAKVKANAGFKRRIVKIRPDTILSENHDLIRSLYDTQETIAIADKQSFQKRVKRLAQRLGFKHVSCYSLRHQLAADAKAFHHEKSTVAKVLGHQTEQTQGNYGNHNQGKKGGMALVISGITPTQPRPAPDAKPVWDKSVTPLPALPHEGNTLKSDLDFWPDH